MAKRVYLYGFNKLLKIEDCKFLEGDAITVGNMLRLANRMAEVNPAKLTIYAVDNRPGLHKEYLESRKTRDFTKHVEFADTVSREGILLSSGK